MDEVRVKELEAKVKHLESENQKLLNKVFSFANHYGILI